MTNPLLGALALALGAAGPGMGAVLLAVLLTTAALLAAAPLGSVVVAVACGRLAGGSTTTGSVIWAVGSARDAHAIEAVSNQQPVNPTKELIAPILVEAAIREQPPASHFGREQFAPAVVEEAP